MMKKLSGTFRRRSSQRIGSGSSASGSSDPASAPADSALAGDSGLMELTIAYRKVLAEQNRQVDELQRLRAIAGARIPGKARAMTFSVGDDPVPEDDALGGEQIPFFADKAAAGVAVVRGKPPVWSAQKENAPRQMSMQVNGGKGGNGGTKPPRQHTVLRESNRMLTAPAMDTPAAIAAAKLDFLEPKRPYVGEGNDRRSKRRSSAENELPLGNTAVVAAPSVPKPPRTKPGQRRWPLPLSVSVDAPQVFTPPAGTTSFDGITHRRDRIEARPLLSACTFLESEVLRMTEQLNATSAAPCCCRAGATEPPLCECGHRMFLTQSVDRLNHVLHMLEDRYDSIEQYYVKSKEYAHAMSRFYQVSESEYSKWAEDRSHHGQPPRVPRKPIR